MKLKEVKIKKKKIKKIIIIIFMKSQVVIVNYLLMFIYRSEAFYPDNPASFYQSVFLTKDRVSFLNFFVYNVCLFYNIILFQMEHSCDLLKSLKKSVLYWLGCLGPVVAC